MNRETVIKTWLKRLNKRLITPFPNQSFQDGSFGRDNSEAME